MPSFLGFSYLSIAGAVAGLVAVVAVPWAITADATARIETRRANTAEAKADDAVRRLSTCQATNQTITAALAEQNTAVARMRADGELRAAQAAKDVQDARSVAESYRKRSAVALATKPGADACASADALILEMIR